MTNFVYAVRFNGVATSAAITLAQVKAPSCCAIEIIRAQITQYGTVVSLQERISLVRKTTRATIPLFTPVALSCSSPPSYAVASSCSCGSGVATAEGVNGNTLREEGFNVLNGFLYLPVPEEREQIEPGEGVGLVFLTAPTTQNWTGGIYFRELR
jgi:hypothetical protein